MLERSVIQVTEKYRRHDRWHIWVDSYVTALCGTGIEDLHGYKATNCCLQLGGINAIIFQPLPF